MHTPRTLSSLEAAHFFSFHSNSSKEGAFSSISNLKLDSGIKPANHRCYFVRFRLVN